MSPSKEPSSEEHPRRVVIVGGGLAGISAAEALMSSASGNFQITLLEAKRQTGGRAGSFSDPVTEETVDYCQHVAMGCCTNFIGLMRRCGLLQYFQRYQQLLFLHPDHPPSQMRSSRWLPPPLHLASVIGNLNYLHPAQRKQVRRGLWRLMRTRRDQIRGQSAADWLTHHGQDAATIRDFWDVVLVSALGEKTDAVSMAAASKVFIDGFAAARSASDLLVPGLALSELFGTRIPEVLRGQGVDVQQGAAVRTIRDHGDHRAVELNDGLSLPSDHIIVAVPWFRLADLLTSGSLADAVDNLEQLATFPASPITGIHLWFDRPITDRPHAVMVGTIAQWLFRDPTENDQGDQHYCQVVISASREARRTPKAELVNVVLAELRHAHPEAREARLIRHRVVTDPQSVFSIRPEVDALRPQSSTALPWLHLAGDWIATGWPATMEGAVISGRMAAASVLSQEGLKPVDIDDGLPRGLLARLLIKA